MRYLFIFTLLLTLPLSIQNAYAQSDKDTAKLLDAFGEAFDLD